MNQLWKNYSLSIVLLSLFIASWIAQALSQYFELLNDAETHAEILTASQFIPSFLSSTFENWQSEFLQLFTFVVLATYLIHKGSPQSKDSDEEVKRSLEQIKKKLKIH